MQLRKAERKKAKLRIGLSGPSGSGKTYSALLLAYGIVGDWDKIALIDSENGSGELYSNLWSYNVLPLDAPYSPERYIEAIRSCEEAGMEAIVIDSISHEWEWKWWCLEINEKLASAKFKGNSWGAWSETTPRHQKFVESIITSKCHIITTARSKTDTIQTEDKKIKKVGTKEIQREGYEYELTANFNIDREHHLAIASKDRTGLFIDRDPFLISSEIGKEIMQWNTSGIDGEARERERIQKEQEERETLYTAIISDMEKIKFIDDLANLWNTQVQANKVKLWEAYIKDLTERKDAIKSELMDNREKDKILPTPPTPVIEEEKSIEEATSTTTFPEFVQKIKSTKSQEELEEIMLEVETAFSMKQIDTIQHGVLHSHKWIMMKKFLITQ